MNFITLKNLVANKLNEDYLTTEIGAQINSTIEYYSNTHLWFNEAAVTIALTTGDPVVPNIPSDFLYETPYSGLTIDFANSRYTLRKLSPVDYDLINNEGSGLPYAYTFQNGTFELYFYPDQDYNLILRYVKSYDELVNDSDTNDWTNNAARLIEYRTIADMYLDYRKDDAMFAVYNQRAEQELNDLRRQNTRLLGNVTLRGETINNGGIVTSINYL